MGRRPKAEHRNLTTTMIAKIAQQDDIVLAIYSAFTKASKTVLEENNANKLRNSKPSNHSGCSMFVRNGIRFSTTFAKQLSLFTSLPCDTQHGQIKAAIIEVAVLSEAVLHKTEHSEGVTKYSKNADTSVITRLQNKGKELWEKLVSLHIAQSEISLLFALILFCSDRSYSDSVDCKELEHIEELVLSTLNYQIILNHSKPLRILSQIIEIISCLRALTTQYLDELLGYYVT